MSKEIKHPAPRKFKGYSLDELRYRLMVNDLKIRLEKGKIAAEFTAEKISTQTTVATLFGNVDRAIGYGQIALMAFQAGKKIVSFIKNIRKKH